MNKYSVYWIKHDVAEDYFYKVDILYRFLKSYQINQDRQDLSTQFRYITYNFCAEELTKHIKLYNQQASIKNHYKISEITLYENSHYILLHICDSHLTFMSRSLQDAEDMLFPMLRAFHPALFIMSHTENNYGWISPMTNIEYKNRHVL